MNIKLIQRNYFVNKVKERFSAAMIIQIMATISAFLIFSSSMFAGPLSGIYKTNPSKSTGGWAYVKFGACKENNSLTCGTLIKAFSKTGKAIKDYEHKGKYIVWDMKKEGNKNFSGGKIKDYSDGRVYNSKMEIISKNKIGVSGCVLFICQSQEWNKLK